MMNPTTVSSAGPATDEATLRVDLAACYRLLAHFGMDDLVYTHISARLPGTRDQFLINPFGMLFSEVTAGSLVKVDHAGELMAPSEHKVNPAGFVIHSAIHMAREDVVCVLHTHTEAGMAVACLEDGLQPLSQWAMFVAGRVGYHDLEGIAVDLDERARLVRDMGTNAAMILRNHGLLTVGGSVQEAFRLMYYFERACRVQLAAMQTGARLRLPPAAVAARTSEQLQGFMRMPNAFLEWPALLRMLDRVDPSYRT